MMMNRLYQWDRLLLDNGGAWPERSTRRMYQIDEISFFDRVLPIHLTLQILAVRRFFRKGVPRHYRAEVHV